MERRITANPESPLYVAPEDSETVVDPSRQTDFSSYRDYLLNKFLKLNLEYKLSDNQILSPDPCPIFFQPNFTICYMKKTPKSQSKRTQCEYRPKSRITKIGYPSVKLDVDTFDVSEQARYFDKQFQEDFHIKLQSSSESVLTLTQSDGHATVYESKVSVPGALVEMTESLKLESGQIIKIGKTNMCFVEVTNDMIRLCVENRRTGGKEYKISGAKKFLIGNDSQGDNIAIDDKYISPAYAHIRQIQNGWALWSDKDGSIIWKYFATRQTLSNGSDSLTHIIYPKQKIYFGGNLIWIKLN